MLLFLKELSGDPELQSRSQQQYWASANKQYGLCTDLKVIAYSGILKFPFERKYKYYTSLYLV